MAIEAKASGNRATVLQAKNLEEIIDARGVALVVNENNLHTIEGWLKILEVKAQ